MHIVLTGNKGSGKTTVLKMMQKKNWKVYEMDKVVHQLYKKGEPGYEAIRKKLGSQFCYDSEINRQKLKEWVLKSTKRMKKLNEIVQPVVSQWIEWEKAKISTKNAVFEMGAFFENYSYFKDLFDQVVYVYKDNVKNEYSKHQLSLSSVIDKVDILIENNETRDKLLEKTLQLF